MIENKLKETLPKVSDKKLTKILLELIEKEQRKLQPSATAFLLSGIGTEHSLKKWRLLEACKRKIESEKSEQLRIEWTS